MLTDSFHAAVFAIIFNKNFRITCYNAWIGPARLESLLAMFELDGSRIRPFNEEFFHFPNPQDACIDYTELASIRERLKEKSLDYLRTSLSKKPTFKKKWHKPTLQDLLCNLDKATDACSFGDEHRFHIRWVLLHAHDLEMTVNELERNQRLSLEKSIHRIEEKVKVLKQNQQSTRFLKKQLKRLLKQNIKAALKRCLPSLLHSPLKKSWFLAKVVCKKVMNKR